LISFLGLHNLSVKEYIFCGILIGLGSVEPCDTLCNVVASLKIKKENSTID
jgi:hypothetical protein